MQQSSLAQQQQQQQQQQQPAAEEQPPATPAAETAAAAGGGDAATADAPASSATPQQQEPLPLPYALDADGKKQPLPGAKSIFLRGGTVDAFGLSALSSTSSSGSSPDDDKPSQLMAAVPKDKLLADIQFQGAISDFHPIKEAIRAADYDPLLLRANADDAYGDGNNWEVAVTQAAAEAWLAADAAAAEAAAAAAVAEAAAAAGADGPDGGAGQQWRKQRRAPQPWQDLGTEAELEAAGIHTISSSSQSSGTAAASPGARHSHQQQQQQGPPAPKSGLLLSRPRRAFGAPVSLSDAPAADLWASNTNEVWPFKDAAYDLKRATLERAAQAVPVLQEAAVQATGGRPRHSCCQTVPQSLSGEQAEAVLATPGFAALLEAVRPRLDEALLQNSLADIMRPDLDQLGDEEAAEAAAAAAAGGGGAAGSSTHGGAAGGRGSTTAAAGAGHRAERGGLTEAQSFTDLAYSKNKVVSAICWVPNRRGVVAAACTDPASQTQRLATMGRLQPAHILIWNFRDPVHPEYVLESPHEVTTFQYNPVNPDIIIGGCYNGQVVVWDTSGSSVAAAASAAAGSGSSGSSKSAAAAAGRSRGGGKSSGSGAAWDDGGEADAVTPVIRHKYLSSVEHSHTTSVCDLCWLPGIEVDRSGKVFSVRANSAGTSAQSMLRSLTLGSTAIAAAAAGSNVPREACCFASIAPDGKVMFWDVRLDKLLKKGNKRVEEADLVWRPMHVVHLLSTAGNDFAGCCFCFDPFRLDSSNFTAGSMEGELLAGHFNRPPGDDNPDYSRLVLSPHAGPVVALSVSPFLPELLLSVGDWTFRLWHHGLEGASSGSGGQQQVPLFVSPQASDTYTAAAWSPSRPGLLFLATSSGTLQVWDLLDRSHEPSLTISVCSCAVTSLAFSNSPPKHFTHGSVAADGPPHAASSSATASSSGQQQQPAQPAVQQGSGLQVLAVGDAAGVLHLFELPRTLRRPLQNERRLMEAFVAREAARVADVASRQALRAAALADSKRQDEAKMKGPEDSSTVMDQQQQQQLDASGTSGPQRHSTIAGYQAGRQAVAAPAPVSGGALRAGSATTTGPGGALRAGSATTTGPGGALRAGSATTTGPGGALRAGSATTTGPGGALRAGSATTTGPGGALRAGSATTTGPAGLPAGAAGAAAVAARAAELAKAEAAYRALEAEFKEQLQLA